VAASFEFGTEVQEVVDFSVEDDPRIAFLVEYGLMASRDINNREAAHAETGAVDDIDAFVIGAAVHNRFAHTAH